MDIDSNLTGEIPVEIGNLVNLQQLDLRNNELSGVFPIELTNFSNLSSLLLNGNQLSGEIPSEIGVLQELVSMDIGNNQFIGEIPESLFDLTNLNDIDSFVKMLIKKEGPIDILFNNAGVSQFGYFEKSDLSVLNTIMELNFFSVIHFTKSILPHMIDKKSGQIVTNTSVAGLVGSRNRSFYSSAKFALHGFFDSLRSEIIQHNVYVTLIAPGRVATDIGINALTESGQLFLNLYLLGWNILNFAKLLCLLFLFPLCLLGMINLSLIHI